MADSLRRRLSNLRGSCVPQSILDEVSALEAEKSRLEAALRGIATSIDVLAMTPSAEVRASHARAALAVIAVALRPYEETTP